MINKLIQIILITFLALSLNAQSFQQVKPWMGIVIEDKTDGVGVKEAISGTPAEKAGIEQGDVIKKIDSTPVKNTRELIGYVQSKGVGNDVMVELIRNKRIVTINLKLEAKPDEIELVRKKVIGKNLPDFKIATISGKPFLSKKDIENKVTIIEFWATWCGPCVASHKKLSEFASENPNIKILAISDEKLDLVKDYAQKKNPKFIILSDTSHELASFFMVSSIPTTAVIDKKGVIRFINTGSGSYQEEAFNIALELDKKK